ncbi:hypothetical protein ACET3Z_006180 [Daucus carota]
MLSLLHKDSNMASHISDHQQERNNSSSILDIHSDIFSNHILTRLDGSSLVSTGSASSELNKFCKDENLWKNICNSTWPSTDDRRLLDIIAAFPAGYRSFFSDCYPSLDHSAKPKVQLVDREIEGRQSLSKISELISAVDIRYDNNLIYSKVQSTETSTDWFLSSPFRVDLLDPKETIPTPVPVLEGNKDLFRSQLDQNLTLCWILVDPVSQRAANLSTLTPVSVERHWLDEDIHAHYVTSLPGLFAGESSEVVQCSILVVCGGTGGDLQIKEVSLLVQDMDGKSLNGRESVAILHEAMEGQRKRKGKREEERERYQELMEMRREMGERKQRRERMMDMVCMLTGVSIFMAFCGFLWLR